MGPDQLLDLVEILRTKEGEENFCYCCLYMLFKLSALAGVAQWIECEPENQRVTGSVPSQDACLGCGPGPQYGARERQPHIDISLFLLLFPSLKMN